MNLSTLAVREGCARTFKDKPYRETLVLRDGRCVTLRPFHHGDVDALYKLFFSCMSFQTRLMRFHCAVNHLSTSALREMTTQVPGRSVALTALSLTDDGISCLLAEARYVVRDDGEAEFALAVADAWQGQGLGRALVQRLCAHARFKGIPALHGTAVSGNEPLLRLLGRLGAELKPLGSEVTVRLSI